MQAFVHNGERDNTRDPSVLTDVPIVATAAPSIAAAPAPQATAVNVPNTTIDNDGSMHIEPQLATEPAIPAKARKILYESSSDSDDDIQVLRRANSQAERDVLARASQSFSQALLVPAPPHRKQIASSQTGSSSSSASSPTADQRKRVADVQASPEPAKRLSRLCVTELNDLHIDLDLAAVIAPSSPLLACDQ